MKAFGTVFVVIVGLYLLVAGHLLAPGPSAEEVADQVVSNWLVDQRMGLSDPMYWAGDAEPVSLYAVRSWEIVNRVDDSLRIVRIESSTQDGVPIIRLWRIRLNDGKIISVQPQD